MGGRRDGTRPRPTSPNAIKKFYNIEQGRVVNLFSTNSMSCTVTSTTSSLGVIVDGLGPIPNSSITTNSIS